MYPVILFYQPWVALGKFLRKFTGFAVKIYQQRNFPSATLSFRKFAKTFKIDNNIKDAVVLGGAS